MKIILGLITLLSLNAFAEGENSNYDMSEQQACVLQIMKESPASLVEACGSETVTNLAIMPFSKMEQPAVFQSAMKQAFLAKLGSPVGLKCLEYDNATALIVICTRP